MSVVTKYLYFFTPPPLPPPPRAPLCSPPPPLHPPSKISTQLRLPSYTDRLWEIQACSALQGLGLKQAFMSVSKLIKKT